jgi:hypothetical protein
MQTLRTLEALEREGLVTRDPRLAEAAESMAIAVTAEMIGLIDRADLASDPIARQFVPDARETEIAPEELADPIGDEARSPVKGIVHRYPDRVLLKPLHVCPVYCRFCFRREKVGPGGEALSADELAAALSYVRQRPEIWEVILTGGDPLMMTAAPPRRAGRRTRRDRPYRRGSHPQPCADRRSVAHHRSAGRRDQAHARRALAGRPLQPSARTDTGQPRGTPAPGGCRHTSVGADGAAGRDQRRRRYPRPTPCAGW